MRQPGSMTMYVAFGVAAGKWKGVTVAVKIVEHGSEAKGGIRQLRESILSSSIIHPNVVRPLGPL